MAVGSFSRGFAGGALRLELPGGNIRELGDGDGPEVVLCLKDRRMARRLVLGGSMALG